MSNIKILALIGNIVNTIATLGLSLLGLVMFLGLISPENAIDPDVRGFVGILVFFLIIGTLILFAETILCWVAFVKIETPSEKNWKIVLLVIGILSLITGSLIVGILFILTFALKSNKMDNENSIPYENVE